MPIKVIFSQDATGGAQKVIIVHLLENSQSVLRKVSSAQECGLAGQQAEAMNILSVL